MNFEFLYLYATSLCGKSKEQNMSVISEKLEAIKNLIDEGLDAKNTVKIFELIGINGYTEELIDSFVLWNDCMPLSDEIPYTKQQRNLHILWETIDRTPLGINIAFAIPFRQIIAKKLFKKCGDGFVANEGCRFNFGQNIEVGKNVSWNHGCYFDSKGGIKFGDWSIVTEYVKVFTHSHSEGDHEAREYGPVEIADYAKVYTASTVLPNVKIGEGAIVGTGSIVTRSVEPYTLVVGSPAKPMRDRKTQGLSGNDFNHYMMKNKMFQVD